MTQNTLANVLAGGLLALLILAHPASADDIVNSNPQAQACQEAAKVGDTYNTGIDECTLVIGGPPMANRDLAAAFVDRGAIYMQHGLFGLAQSDFEMALKLDPGLGNAYVNHGASLIAQMRYADGIADIDRGLPLRPDEPEKAYYNRAIADEGLADLKAAYFDYQKAQALKPSWSAPKSELARFTATVVPATP